MYYHQKNQYINIVSFFHAKSSCKDDVHIVPIEIPLTPPYKGERILKASIKRGKEIENKKRLL